MKITARVQNSRGAHLATVATVRARLLSHWPLHRSKPVPKTSNALKHVQLG